MKKETTSIFPLWVFHLHVAKHFNSNCSMLLSGFPWFRIAVNKQSTEPTVHSGWKSWKRHFERFTISITTWWTVNGISVSQITTDMFLAKKPLNQRPLLVKLKWFYPEAIMTWLTVCSSVLVHNEISPIITYHGIFNMTMGDRAGATSGAGTSFDFHHHLVNR
jgi:hypothetical protein